MLPSVCVGKNMLPRIVRSPIQWPVVVQKKVLWCLKVCTDFFYLFILYQSVIIAILCNCLLQLLVINQIKLYFGSWFSTFFILLLRFAKDVKGENKQMSLSLIKVQPLKRLSLTVTNAAFMQKNLIVGEFLKWIDYHQTFRDIFENLSVCN